ncbi:ketoacyl-ACP synthase III family protein [Gordonia sp. CPCC 206044]|uniref:ketoacyl-ACP synthase III family protein n=1 Tax=Gordonia sp. CPCC 206044 TaxID=3140793 RepID=UPI003AF37314
MRFDNVYIDSIGTYLPTSRPLSDVVACGEMSADELRDWGWTGVSVAGDVSPPDMAIAAGRDALKSTTVPRDQFSLLIHAASLFQGSVMWPAHHYIQRHTIGDQGTAFEVRQVCSGGLAALQLAGSMVSACDNPSAVLVTGADNHFWYDRFEWVRHHRGLSRNMPLPGDAAHAIVVTNTGGFAKVTSVATASVPEFEEAFRKPGRPFPVPLSAPTPTEIREITAAVEEHPQWLRALSFRTARTALAAVEEALELAGLTPGDIKYFLPGFGGDNSIADLIIRRYPMPLHEGVQQFGRSVGHLSVNDHAVGLLHLTERNIISSGDNVLLGAHGLAASLNYVVVTIV